MNNVILIGRLVRDPELRYNQGSGMALCQFTIAVDKNLSRDKKQQFEAQGKPTADFIRIVVWGKQAENCNTYLEKGRKVAVQGSISTSSYKAQNGETRYSTDVLANQIEFLEWGEKKENQGAPRRQSDAADSNFSSFDNDYPGDFQAIEDDSIPF